MDTFAINTILTTNRPGIVLVRLAGTGTRIKLPVGWLGVSG